MADTGAPHSLPYLAAGDPPSLHGATHDLAVQTAARIGFVGRSIIATSESRSSTSYGLLTTPDRVQNVVVPTDGLIEISYQALWQTTASDDAFAAIFIGSNQIKIQAGSGSTIQPRLQAGYNTSNTSFAPLVSTPYGLVGTRFGTASSDVTTGQIEGMIIDDGVSGSGTTAYGKMMLDAVSADLNVPQAGGAGTINVAGFAGALRVFAAAGTYDVSVQFKSTGGGAVNIKERKLRVRALVY